jgi:DNA recombination protein RmuC
MGAILSILSCAFLAAGLAAWHFARREKAAKAALTVACAKADEAATALAKAGIDLAQLREKLAAADNLAQLHAADLTRARQEASDKALKAFETNAELAALRASSQKEREAYEARIGELKALREELSNAFGELSRKALGENSESFLKLAGERLEKLGAQNAGELDKRRAAVEAMVKPLSETLAKVGEKVDFFDKARAESFARMDEQMKGLAGQEETLRRQTQSLAEALRKPSVRGAWGEMQLRRVVEFAGMVEKCHFSEQVVTSATNKPDMIVKLPNGLDVVVDSKAPMDAYLRAVEATDEEARRTLMDDHARQFRDKIRQLGSKKYTEDLDLTPEFTVLFVPFESLFSAALSSDPELIDFGRKNGVVIATPTTLIALLMAVSKGWQDKAIADNALQLKNECAALYDSVCVFLGHYASVGEGLEKAIGSYNKSVGSIQSRVMPKLARMNELGGFDKDGVKIGKKEIAEIAESHPRELPAPGK